MTVEASSPELIEKVRSTVTDTNGQYRIEDLRPGSYVVTFRLPGFTTVQRPGIELTGSFAARVDADMRVGTLEETITVTGESPVVDVVNANKQATLTNETISVVPSARLYHSLVALVPGVSLSGTQDVGGISGPVTVTFSMRGGQGNEGRLTVDGLSLGASLNGTGVSYTVADVGNAQEVVFTTAGGLGESEVGGPAMNVVPKQGGNRFSGSFFANGANDSFQTSNFDDDVRAAGLAAPPLLKKIWDVNGAIGGPILMDRLWFFSAVRHQGNRRTVSIFQNRNENDLSSWHYAPAEEQSLADGTWKNASVRFTYQATARNKFNFFWDEQRLCTSCIGGGSATVAPEARGNNHAPPRVQQITWSSPATNRLLLEAGFGANRIDQYGTRPNISNFSEMIPVTELCLGGAASPGCVANGGIPGLQYRSISAGAYVADSDVYNWRTSASLVTGRNAMKVGYTGQQIINRFPNAIRNDRWLGYTFNNGAPWQFTQFLGPARFDTYVQTHALYVQDQWTVNKLTLSGAVRYDRSASEFPEQSIGPNPFLPTQQIIPATDGTSYHEISPRMGATYDIFGDGKTAIKLNIGRYLAPADGSSITGALTNPLNRMQLTSGVRTWTDANGNYMPDCDLMSMTAQDLRPFGGDFCGAGNAQFGQQAAIVTVYDPAIIEGWGLRPYDWNFGVQVQQQLLPRVSVEVGYFRRTFGNFSVTDNHAVAASDFDTFSVVVPSDSRLPGGGGNTLTELYDVRPDRFGLVDNFVTLSKNYGRQTRVWNGVEVNMTARVRGGLTVQGGTSTGRTVTDNCEIRRQLPEIAPLNPYCLVSPPFQTQGRGLVSYIIPKIDVQIGATFQSIPGAALAANYGFPNAQVAASLGRNLSGNAQVAQINVVTPGDVFGDRINQIDLRVGKLLRFGRMRSQFSVDLYNALNSNAVQTYNQQFIINGSWPTPTAILPARFAKLTAQIDF